MGAAGRPLTLKTLVADVGRRAGQLIDLGHVRLIDCAGAARPRSSLATGRCGRLCRVIGDRHLAVLPDQELRFRKALIASGYVVPGRAVT